MPEKNYSKIDARFCPKAESLPDGRIKIFIDGQNSTGTKARSIVTMEVHQFIELVKRAAEILRSRQSHLEYQRKELVKAAQL